MEKDLKGSKILYLGAKFFGYELEIKSMLEKMGAEVDFFNERPNDSFSTRVIIRLNLKGVISRLINSYYNELVEETKKKKYDYVFVISPETIPEKHLLALRISQKDSKFLLYMWDSFKNKNAGYDLTKYFDKIMTFDENDAKNNNKLVFLPLFYIPIYKSISKIKEPYRFDYFLACTIHSDRYNIIRKLKSQAAKKGVSFYSFLYFHNKILFWGRKFFDPYFFFAKKSEFSFTPINQHDIVDVVSRSKIIIDFQHPNQTGLTNRTFEALGAGKKLITTNSNIKKYDFYNPNNIFVIDRKNPILDEDFLRGDYQEPSASVYNKYSLDNWLRVIYNIEKKPSPQKTRDALSGSILITGISGFVGNNVVKYLGALKTFIIYGLDIRSPKMQFVDEIFGWNDFERIPNVDAIIHLAGKAHFTTDSSNEQEYIDVNFGLTKKIYDFFLKSSAKQFYLMSSVAASATNYNGILSEEKSPNPTTPYGRSKLMAEEYLFAKPFNRGKFVYAFRPCMIYGPNNKGNLNLLFNLVSKGIPWPLGSYENKRSFLSVVNLSSAFQEFLTNDFPSGVYQLADDDPISTNEIIRIIAKSVGKKIRIFYFSKKTISFLARIGTIMRLPLTEERLEKLTENFVVSNEKIRKVLNNPFPIKTVDGMRNAIKTFKSK